MPSLNRTAQLGIWREIVSRRHEETQPVNQHLTFIRSRFEELDSKGFHWSKESILGIFLQIGLSECPRGPFSLINEIFDSLVLQGVELSSDGIEEVIRNEESRHTRPPGLMDLPIEVFDQILEDPDHLTKLESHQIFNQKYDSRVEIKGPGDRKPYMTYLHGNPPLLNSFQSFSLTSREVYQRCRPRLWRTLQFPSSLPAPIDLWTKDILIRQGSYVRYLSIQLSENCSRPPGGFKEHHPFYDNLNFQFHPNTAAMVLISPKNVQDLIDCCPKLSFMDIQYQYYEELEDVGGTEAFLLDLIPSLSSLEYLRHLRLDTCTGVAITNELTSKLIGSLPLLESIDFSGLSMIEDERKLGSSSLGSNLSKLKNLSQLKLYQIGNIDESWCLYEWPGTLTDLEIRSCGDLSPSSVHLIVHHIAPNAKTFTLSLTEQGDEPWKTNLNNTSQIAFSLPLLANLRLSTRHPNSLGSFRDCISIKTLRWDYGSLEHCRSLNNILFQAPWPHLKKLIVFDHCFSRDPDLAVLHNIEASLDSLVRYCKQTDMKVIKRSYKPRALRVAGDE